MQYLVRNMSCLSFVILFVPLAAEAEKGAQSILALDHPISQAILALGGIGVIAYIGASRGPRIRLPQQTQNSEIPVGESKDESDAP